LSAEKKMIVGEKQGRMQAWADRATKNNINLDKIAFRQIQDSQRVVADHGERRGVGRMGSSPASRSKARGKAESLFSMFIQKRAKSYF